MINPVLSYFCLHEKWLLKSRESNLLPLPSDDFVVYGQVKKEDVIRNAAEKCLPVVVVVVVLLFCFCRMPQIHDG